MNPMMRLYVFEFFQGNRIAIKALIKRFGLLRAVKIVLELKRRIWFKNPFAETNRCRVLLEAERASQHQIAPAFVLYDILKEMGYDEEVILNDIQALVSEVATAFLKFNVPIITPSDYLQTEASGRMEKFRHITARFFNAAGELSSVKQDTFRFTVNRCLFAEYSRQLGYPQLAPIFCSADRLYFEQHQPHVTFSRNTTLAEHRKPCDFAFKVTVEQSNNNPAMTLADEQS